MGQKTNPKGFRLITTQKHLSNFYSNKFIYPSIIKEDYIIRAEIIKLFSTYLSLSNVEINRTEKTKLKKEFVDIKINLLYPRKKQIDNFILAFFCKFNENNEIKNLLYSKYKFKYKRKRLINSRLRLYALFILKRHIKKFLYLLRLKNKKNYSISIKLKKNLFEDSVLIARYIAQEIKKRVKVRRIIKTVLKRIFAFSKSNKILGVKIQVSGRLNGIEMARKEWKRTGRLPLHTLKSFIDYSYEYINTIYGTIGIKVWLFKGLK